jgi:hypothetical protein
LYKLDKYETGTPLIVLLTYNEPCLIVISPPDVSNDSNKYVEPCRFHDVFVNHGVVFKTKYELIVLKTNPLDVKENFDEYPDIV